MGNRMTVFICSAKVYEWNGIIFEYGYSGPWPLKKDGELKKKAGIGFFKKVDAFCKLPEEEKAKYRIGGGCNKIEC